MRDGAHRKDHSNQRRNCFDIGAALMLATAISGCGMTLRAPEPVLREQSEARVHDVSAMIKRQAAVCWQVQFAFGKDGKDIRLFDQDDGGVVVEVNRISSTFHIYRGTYGVRHEQPFLVIQVSALGSRSNVTVSEGDYDCNPLTLSCSKLGLAPQVRKWLAGDYSCR
jgi:hypothetical protein